MGKSIGVTMVYCPGEVILANVQFPDLLGIKKRPVVVLFEEFGNIVVAGITSNLKMKGILLSEDEGAIKPSIIKTNYIFTLGEELVEKKLFMLSKKKKEILYKELDKKLSVLKE